MPYQLCLNLIMSLEANYRLWIQFEADSQSNLIILRIFTTLFYKNISLKYTLVQKQGKFQGPTEVLSNRGLPNSLNNNENKTENDK